MSSPAPSPAQRPVLGLRKRPGRLALFVFRMPLRAARSGHLPSRTFVKFVHTGRTSGRPYETVAMVLRHDKARNEVSICAAWGLQTDWVRNLLVAPAVSVQLGNESFTARARFLDDDEAFDVIAEFRRHHPVRLRLMSAALGWGELRNDEAARAFVRTHPFVAFRSAS
jgi:deazaflavin-dependent oxidoreductase (nitroreductase family)